MLTRGIAVRACAVARNADERKERIARGIGNLALQGGESLPDNSRLGGAETFDQGGEPTAIFPGQVDLNGFSNTFALVMTFGHDVKYLCHDSHANANVLLPGAVTTRPTHPVLHSGR